MHLSLIQFVRYYRTKFLSEKSDVYSFRVVLLEIVTNVCHIDKNREKPHIVEWVGFNHTNVENRRIVERKLMDIDLRELGVYKVT